MNKRILITVFIALAIVVSMVGCNKSDNETVSNADNIVETTLEYDKNIIKAEEVEDVTHEYVDSRHLNNPKVFRINNEYDFDIESKQLVMYFGNEKDIIVPSKFIIDSEKYNVEGIGDSVYMNKGINSVELHEGLLWIGPSTFWQNNITTLNIPSTLEIIGNVSFAENKIKEINIPKNSRLTGLGEMALYQNEIEEIKLPKGIDLLGNKSLGNNKIKRIEIYEKARMWRFISNNPLEEVIVNTSEEIFINNIKNDNTIEDIFGNAKIIYNK